MAYSREDKNKVIEELGKQMGNVTRTCQACGVPRSTYEHWLRHDKTFARQAKEAEKVAVDFCAYKMYQLAAQGNFKALKYILSTKGKEYGWGPESGSAVVTNTVTMGEVRPPAIIFSGAEGDGDG